MSSSEAPIFLALESSQRSSTISLDVSGKVHSRAIDLTQAKSSALLLPMVKELLSELGVKPEMITDLAVNMGPGSGTGLRMGIAFAQAWSLVYPEIKIHGVPFEMIALESLKSWDPASSRAQLLSDAFGGQIFRQMYIKHEGKWKLEGDLRIIEKKEALHEHEPLATIADLGALRTKEVWPETWTWFEGVCPRSQEVLVAAQSGQYLADIQTLDVRYLKKTSAEINWELRQQAEARVETK